MMGRLIVTGFLAVHVVASHLPIAEVVDDFDNHNHN